MSWKEQIKAYNKAQKGSKDKMQIIHQRKADGRVYLGYSQTITDANGKPVRVRKLIKGASFIDGQAFSEILNKTKKAIADFSKQKHKQIEFATLASQRQTVRKTKLIIGDDNTISVLMLKWLDTFSQRSTRNHMAMISNNINGYAPLAHKPITAITPEDCKAFANYLKTKNIEENKPYSNASQRQMIDDLRRFFTWAIVRNVISSNPAQNVFIKKIDKPVQFFHQGELDLLKTSEDKLIAKHGDKLRDMISAFWLIRFCGIRPIDLETLTFAEIGKVINDKFVFDNVITFTQSKTKKLGTLILASKTPRAIMQAQWDKNQDLSRHIFELPHRSNLGIFFADWCKLAKIVQGQRTYYKAKHTLGTDLGKQGLTEMEIGLFFGHSNSSRGATRYYISPNLDRCKLAQIEIDK